MAATRTQIYLTADQRAKIETLRQRDGRSLAEIVRQALDTYLMVEHADADTALASTFGVHPAFTVPPRDEWTRG